MTGTLIKKKTSKNREYFYINLSFKDPLTKEWKTKTVRTGLQVQGNKRKAEKMIPDMIEKYQHLEEAALTRETATRNITLCDYLDIWLEEKKHEVKHSTYEGYAARIRSIKRYFEPKGILLKDIKPRDLDIYFKWCLSSGKIHQKTGEPQPLSVRSTRSYKSILSAAFDQAISKRLIIRCFD
ncbi:MAG: phage integrase SAM-like domain-containing protein [Eubacterium sp.]|nr:phage integrase SAM-like domain-containing protein [Eubacterium sp.]